MYNKSVVLSSYVVSRCSSGPIDSTALAANLSLAVNDIPLLLAIASSHTPNTHELVLLDF